MRKLFLTLSLTGCGLIAASPLSAQTPELKPMPLFEQCAELKDGGSADDEVARAIKIFKGADSRARIEAAQRLGLSCDRRAVDPLLEALRDEDPAVHIAAIEALARLGAPESITPLIDDIFSKDWRVRLALAGALASFKTFNARNMVVNGIANPNMVDITDQDDLRVRCIAILTVNQLKDVSHSRKAILFVYHFLRSSNPDSRRLAEQTMRELKETRNAPIELIAILKQSPDPELRRWSAEWLGKLGIERSRGLLEEKAALDSDEKVRQAATQALKALGRK